MPADEYLGWMAHARHKGNRKQMPQTAEGITATLSAMGYERKD